MNLEQLRIVNETVRQDFNLTTVADVLYTSQPGVSRHLKELEDELGVEIFVRRGKRLVGLTEPGKELIGVVERIVLDTRNLKRIADQFSARDRGNLVVAATHTQARYALPGVIKAFRSEYPGVHLVLHQGSPREIAEMVASGEADLAVATERVDTTPGLSSFPAYTWHHAIIVPVGHPLAGNPAPGLAEIAEHPIVTYHEGFTGRSQVDAAFAGAGLIPDVVLSAIDADVIKTYVELGLGIGIVAAMAYDPRKDAELVVIPADHLFPGNTTKIGFRNGAYLRDYAFRFVALLAPHLDIDDVKRHVS
ncbi:MAG: CysB family HTH-type transcriptional regulator, partial [Rhodocyclaceae bacterium]|nr:CysB family HTH-type transcriptional regulator [Rhodocyclaceae bacterium]